MVREKLDNSTSSWLISYTPLKVVLIYHHELKKFGLTGFILKTLFLKKKKKSKKELRNSIPNLNVTTKALKLNL